MSSNPKPTVIEPPSPPSAPTAGQSYGDYAKAQLQYAPQMAQLDYQLQSQYDPQYAQTEYNIQNQLYPQTTALQEGLAKQATDGMNQPVPPELVNQFKSDFNAGIGMNVNAPLGITDRNVALLNLQKQWGDYYRNLGLSVANKQPLVQGQNQNFSGSMQNINGALNYAAQNFGTQTQGYNSSLANRIVQPRYSSLNQALQVGSQAANIGSSFAMMGGF